MKIAVLALALICSLKTFASDVHLDVVVNANGHIARPIVKADFGKTVSVTEAGDIAGQQLEIQMTSKKLKSKNIKNPPISVQVTILRVDGTRKTKLTTSTVITRSGMPAQLTQSNEDGDFLEFTVTPTIL